MTKGKRKYRSSNMVLDTSDKVLPERTVLNRNPSWPIMQKGSIEISSACKKRWAMATIDIDDERFSVLSFEQVMRLSEVMKSRFSIHGRGNFPTLDIQLKDIVNLVKSKLLEDDIIVRDIRLNGGVASHVLSLSSIHTYNDLDLIFTVDIKNNRGFDKIKNAVLDCLMDLLPDYYNKTKVSSCCLKEAYVHKMVKVCDGDLWSLISLSNVQGKNIELKFVDSMKRQFEFSVDSFQVILDSLLLFYDCADMRMSEYFYPTVIGESVYGDFEQALSHLHQKLITTFKPEEIRGGGLLKFCHLLVKKYKVSDDIKLKKLERYMCSRFFIDFPSITQQQNKLENYLWNHFPDGEIKGKFQYLMTLHRIINQNTVCLTSHERRQTLNLIEVLAFYIFGSDLMSRTHSHVPRTVYHFPRFNRHHRKPRRVLLPQTVVYSNGYYFYPSTIVSVTLSWAGQVTYPGSMPITYTYTSEDGVTYAASYTRRPRTRGNPRALSSSHF